MALRVAQTTIRRAWPRVMPRPSAADDHTDAMAAATDSHRALEATYSGKMLHHVHGPIQDRYINNVVHLLRFNNATDRPSARNAMTNAPGHPAGSRTSRAVEISHARPFTIEQRIE